VRRDTVKHLRQRLQHHSITCVGARRIAIVHQQDIPRGKSTQQTPSNRVRISRYGIEAASRPRSQVKSHSRQHWFEEWVAQPSRRTKEDRALSDDGHNRLLPGADLAGESAHSEQGKRMRVMLGMVLDAVPPRDDLPA
jgi:hypothetical protein